MLSQELSIGLAEVWNVIENIPPHVEVIALMDYAVVWTDGQFGAPKEGGGRIFIEYHHHFPLKKNLAGVRGDREDLHVQLFTALGEAGTHLREGLHPLNTLDAVLKDDLLMIVWEDV